MITLVARPPKIIFVTGTDTGVGKTLLTALLLQHLRANGCHALAMKPFCSGGRGDVELLQSLQPGELSDEEMNPFYFPEPVAPLVAVKNPRQKITFHEVVERIQFVKNKCGHLVVEGSGGLLVPLGRGFNVADLIASLDCKIIVVARNQLGTINHTMLTVEALKERGLRRFRVVLMGCENADVSSKSNSAVLEALTGAAIFSLPYLGVNPSRAGAVLDNQKKMKKTLAQILR